MPELPEVECVRRGLQRARLRAPLREIWRSELPLRIGANWRIENLGALEGGTPGGVERRGKYLLWGFTVRRREYGLLVHLGMTGRLRVTPRDAEPLPHTHLVLRFADDREVHFVDPRRFGGVRAAARATLIAEPPLCELGPEPLGPAFDGETLATAAGRSKRTVRDVLLDQRVVAGVGNIYVSEALFLAGVHPLVAAARLRQSAWERVADGVRSVLARAIDNGGTTLRDYRGTGDRPGRNQDALFVYGRAGEPCLRCGTTLVGFVHGGRSGAYCPRCQARPRSRRIA
jgi:formamidopyrimidine-DNA glycosylase